ncbi:MAG: glycosyltransferase family 9 protein [Blastocatellia bacterium]|nr:glycosyltransferase family 9 protein [Blastocatellia bacterium]
MTDTQNNEMAARDLAEFRLMRGEAVPDRERAGALAGRAAERVLAEAAPVRDAIRLLCEMSADEDEEIARMGGRALFGGLIERLNDSFEPAACGIYDRLFAQVIDFYRRRPGAEPLDEALRGFGLATEADLSARKSRLRDAPTFSRQGGSIKRVLLPSRVTIGADVALTSVIIAKLREALPNAEFVFLGSPKLRELYGGDARIRVRPLGYERSGRVQSRLASWLDVLAAVREERRDLGPEELLIIDPDSRLTQLGLLPLIEGDVGYHFFESRAYRHPEAARIGELASRWLAERFGLPEMAFPFLALPPAHADFGRRLGESLRRGGARHLTTISFGVGGNEEKRISAAFERALIEERLAASSTLVLDKGASPDERRQIDEILEGVRAQGRTVVEVAPESAAVWMGRDVIHADVLTWDGGIGEFAGLIAAADRYIGYDSAGQHLAAALRVPTLTLFVNANSATFAERWRPFGPGPISVAGFRPDNLPVSPREIGEL